MATNLEIAGAVKRTQKGAADWYYGGDNEAWPDMATALANIPASVRPGKTIGVFTGATITEYWWPTEAVADNNLVPKSPDLSAYATTSYVDSALVSAIKLRGDWDISSGTYPETGGTGETGSIKEGNAWRISKAGTIGTQSFDTGDFIVALADNPAQTPANWTVLEHNDQQATETEAGTGRIALQTDIQNEATTNDTDTVTPKKFWQGASRYDTTNRTITGDRVFTGAIDLKNANPTLTFSNTGSNNKASFDYSSTQNSFIFNSEVNSVGGLGSAVLQATTSQYLRGSDAGLPTGSNINATFCITFKTTSQQGSLSFLGYGNTLADGLTIDTSAHPNLVRVVNNQQILCSLDLPEMRDGKIHNLIVTIAGSTAVYYLDGVAYALPTLPAYSIALNGGFGTTGTIPNLATAGMIGQILVYNRVISTISGPGGADEIAAIYNQGTGTLNIPQNGLLRSFLFTETSGTTAADTNTVLGAPYPLTLYNGATFTGSGNGLIAQPGSLQSINYSIVKDGINATESNTIIDGDINSGNWKYGHNIGLISNNIIRQITNPTGTMFSNTNTNQTPTLLNPLSVQGSFVVGSTAAIMVTAPTDGAYIEGATTLKGGATDIINTFGTMPENRLTTADNQYSRFVRRVDLSNNQLEGRNNLLQVGGIGKALQFSAASSQYVTMPATNLGGIGSSISACIWFKTTQIGQGIFQIGNSSPNKRMGVAITGSNQAFFYYQGGNIQSGTTSFPLNDSIWHHAAVTYTYDTNGGAIRLYIDGNLIATNQAGDGYYLQPNETNILLGQANVDGSTHYFTGTLDQFVIYGKALTQAEVIAIYNNRSGTASLPSPADILRRYDFEEGTGNFTADSNPNATKYTATLINGVNWNNIGIVPVSANSGESSFFKVIDGQTNGERGIAVWGDFNGRNQQQGRWFQFFQNITYPFVSNNTGQWLFNPNNSNPGLPVVASTVDIAGNLTIGTDAAGAITAPANGLYVQGTAQFPAAQFTGYANAVGSTPEIRWTTNDTQYSRFLRRVDLSNNQFEGRNNVLQVGGIGKAIICGGGTQQAAFSYPTSVNTTFSQSIWFKTSYDYSVVGSENSIIAFVGSYGNWFWLRVNQNNTLSACVSGQITTAFTVNDGKWHNVVYTQNSLGSGNFYVDNVLIGTATLSADISAGNGYIGYTAPGIAPLDAKPFIGQTDQYLLYNTVLTSTEVTVIYNSGSGTANPPTVGLIRRYEFEEGTGTTTADTNPNITQSNALLNNGITWNSIGIVPVLGGAAEMIGFKLSDGLTNGERGIATWGDFNGRNQQQGRWFQFFQNVTYPLVSNNTGQWRFDPGNTFVGLPNVASTIDVAGNLTVGFTAAGDIEAPANGIYSEGDIITAANLNIGNKLKIATGTNASIGTASLSAGTVTINTTAISADSIIIYCVKVANGIQGYLSQGILTPGESFAINSSSSADASTINWWIIN